MGVNVAVMEGSPVKDNKWTKSIAVESSTFIEEIKTALGFRVKGRGIIGSDGTFQLRESLMEYGNYSVMNINNTYLWDQPLISIFHIKID